MISKTLFDELIDETVNESVTPWFRTEMERQKQITQSPSFYSDASKSTTSFLDAIIQIPLAESIVRQISSDFLILPTPNYAAESIRTPEGGVIILHEGLLNLLSFYLDCIYTVDLLREERIEFSDDELYNLGIAHRPTIDNITQLYIAIIYNYLTKPFQLPVLQTRPTNTEKLSALVMQLICTELFIILHESAHIELGHHPMLKVVQYSSFL
jgi:hypothetical protein